MSTKNTKLFIALDVFLFLILILVIVRGCANAPATKSDAICKEGEQREGLCPAGTSGRLLQACHGGKFEETFKDCKPSDCPQTVFDRDLQPLITQKCLSCHPGFNTFDVAKTKIDEMIRRVFLTDEAQRMPKGAAPLSADEQNTFKDWKADGLLPACANSTANNNPHLTLDYVEAAIEADLEQLNSADQPQARYLITSHKSDEGADLSVLTSFGRAVQKSVNSMSFARNIVLAKPVDQYGTVYRFLLRDVKLAAADWTLVENADPVNFESFTNQGLLIKQLTKTRKPWMEVDTFAFTSNQPDTYYAIRKLPATAQALFTQEGVDFNGELDNTTALQVGFNNSPIALNKNRLIARFDALNGEMYITFDVDQNKISADRNLFNFPLLRSPSGKSNYTFDASEIIGSLPNSLHFYYLAASKKVLNTTVPDARQNAAPLTVVADNISPFSPEIKTAISCYRCHNGGYIHEKDEVRQHVDENAAQFILADVDFVDILYRDPEPNFTADNNAYAEALAKMGLLPSDADPVNLVSDNLRRNFTADSVAALLLITKQEFLDGLNRSAEGRQQVGQLLTGGEITFQQLQASLPVLFRDLRIGLNPL